MAVVDVLISKTFDASVICPAEQMLVVDDAIHDEVMAELERMGARVLSPADVDALAAVAFDEDGARAHGGARALVRRPRRAGRLRGRTTRTKVLLAPLPADLEELAAHPLVREKLMPVLGVVRSPSVDHAIAACELVTEHGGLGHTSGIYADDDAVIERFAAAHPHRAGARQRADGGGRAGRRLQPDDPDLLARAAARGAARRRPTTSTTATSSTSRPSRAGRRRRSGSACPPRRTSGRARSRTCAP